MNKIAAYEMILETHPLWDKEASLREKMSRGIEALRQGARVGREAARETQSVFKELGHGPGTYSARYNLRHPIKGLKDQARYYREYGLRGDPRVSDEASRRLQGLLSQYGH